MMARFSCKTSSFALVLLSLVLVLGLSACGRKGDLSLRSYQHPPAPADLRVVHREDSFLLLWTPAAMGGTGGAAVVETVVFRSTGGEFEKLTHLDPKLNSYEDKDISTGKSYSYKLSTVSAMGVFSESSNVAAASVVQPPSAPAGLRSAISGDRLILAWDSAAAGTLFNVYRSYEAGKYGISPLNAEPLAANGFEDMATLQRKVYYTVRALKEKGIRHEGPASQEISVEPSDFVPSAPTSGQFFALPDSVILSWDPPSEPWVFGFRVYRNTGSGYAPAGESQVPTFIDHGPALSPRDYRIHAVGPAKEGPGLEIRGVVYKAPEQP